MLNWKIRSDIVAETNSSFDEIYLQYINTLNSPETGFFHLPKNQELLQQTKIVFESHYKI